MGKAKGTWWNRENCGKKNNGLLVLGECFAGPKENISFLMMHGRKEDQKAQERSGASSRHWLGADSTATTMPYWENRMSGIERSDPPGLR